MKRHLIANRLYIEYGLSHSRTWGITTADEEHTVLIGLHTTTHKTKKGRLLCLVIGPVILKFGFKRR